MDVEALADLLHEAAETHHRVYRITDGEDPDWASWYADWLIRLSELPAVLGRAPVGSELVYLLVCLVLVRLLVRVLVLIHPAIFDVFGPVRSPTTDRSTKGDLAG